MIISDDCYSLFYCEHDWYSLVRLGMVSVEEMRRGRHICETFLILCRVFACVCRTGGHEMSDVLYSYGYLRASCKILRQDEVLHRLHASAVPSDASSA